MALKPFSEIFINYEPFANVVSNENSNLPRYYLLFIRIKRNKTCAILLHFLCPIDPRVSLEIVKFPKRFPLFEISSGSNTFASFGSLDVPLQRHKMTENWITHSQFFLYLYGALSNELDILEHAGAFYNVSFRAMQQAKKLSGK